jgi:hypothetical protein
VATAANKSTVTMFRSRHALAVLASFFAGAMFSTACGQVVISSLPAVPDSGISNVVDSGQTFTVPTSPNNDLENFTFYMGGVGVPIEFV